MANSKEQTNTNAKEVTQVENKYYTAYPSYDDNKKVKGLILTIEGTTYYIDLKDPVITTKTRGDKVIFTKKEYNVAVLPKTPMTLHTSEPADVAL